MTVKDLLTGMRDLLSDPDRWCQENLVDIESQSYCIVGAALRAYGFEDIDIPCQCVTDTPLVVETMEYLCQTVGCGPKPIWIWNDASGRAHAEVIEALNMAITNLELAEQKELALV